MVRAALVLLLLTGCVMRHQPPPVADHDEFFCDDTPDLDPERCGLTGNRT